MSTAGSARGPASTVIEATLPFQATWCTLRLSAFCDLDFASPSVATWAVQPACAFLVHFHALVVRLGAGR